MKSVITYGTFDLFHVGHLNLLRKAKSLGDRLIVGVSTDSFNELKGKKTIIPYDDRSAIIKAIRYVDKVIPEDTWEQKTEDIRRFKINVLVMGEDWQGKFDDMKDYCEVVYLPRTKIISTSHIKESIALLNQIAQEYSF